MLGCPSQAAATVQPKEITSSTLIEAMATALTGSGAASKGPDNRQDRKATHAHGCKEWDGISKQNLAAICGVWACQRLCELHRPTGKLLFQFMHARFWWRVPCHHLGPYTPPLQGSWCKV